LEIDVPRENLSTLIDSEEEELGKLTSNIFTNAAKDLNRIFSLVALLLIPLHSVFYTLASTMNAFYSYV